MAGRRGPRLVLGLPGQWRPVRPDRAFARALGDLPRPPPPLVHFLAPKSLVRCALLGLLALLSIAPVVVFPGRAFARVREPGHLLLSSWLLGPVCFFSPDLDRAFARVLVSGLLSVLLGLLLGLLVLRLQDIVSVLLETQL